MEKEHQRNIMTMNHHMNVVTFRNIPHNVVSEMAKHLDTHADANWEALADLLRLSIVDIRVSSLVLLCV